MLEEKKQRPPKKKRQKVITVETIALRKMREMRGLDRKQAAVLFGVSFKTLEKAENGRTVITPTVIETYCKTYGFSRDDFRKICNGKASQVETKIGVKGSAKPKRKRIRRYLEKIITKEVLAIRTLRKKRKISQYKASALCGFDRCTFGQIENGRINITQSKIKRILAGLGYTMEDFNNELLKKYGYSDLIDYCTSIIHELDESQLLTVKNILQTFQPTTIGR